MDNEPTNGVSEATKLRALGVEVTLADGKRYPLRFDFEALYIIEEEFTDGLDELVARLSPKDPKKQGWTPGRVKAIGTAMEAALIHTGMSRVKIRKLLEFKQIIIYLEALIDAFNQAMPEVDESARPKAAGSAADSPGNSSTTSAPSDTGARTRRSGG
jgi:hypothetical protein